jgi:hypothetical protein
VNPTIKAWVTTDGLSGEIKVFMVYPLLKNDNAVKRVELDAKTGPRIDNSNFNILRRSR